MDENKWLSQLRERADQSMFKDVHFTPGMQQGVREKVSKRASSERYGTAKYAVGICGMALLVLLMWQVWPQKIGLEHASTSSTPPPLRTVETWEPSPAVTETYDGMTYTYIGERPVRVITDETNIYEAQQQKWMWLLNGEVPAEVEIFAYRSDGKQVNLGTYATGGELYDADHHFPSGIVLPEPGIWKLHVQAGGSVLSGVFVEVKEGVSPSNRSWVESLITRYLQQEQEQLKWLGADREVTLDLFYVEAPSADRRRAYAEVLIVSGENGAGVSAPMAFDILYVGNDYRVTGFEMPEDGNRYMSSLERIFPERARELLRNRE